MTTEAKTDPKVEEPPKTDPKVEDKKPDPEPEGESLGTRVAAEVKKALGSLIGGGEVKVEDKKPEGEPAKKEPVTQREVEGSAKDAVKAALKEIHDEEAQSEDRKLLAQLKETVIDKPPRKIGRLTKAVWGKDAFE